MPVQSTPANQHRETLTGSGSVNANGSFEILAITAGTGNGWDFSAEVLKASLSLWDKAECYIDHSWFGHSVRDLAGFCHSPAWDDDHLGIKLQLKPVGPSGPLLAELGKQVLEEDNPANPNVGFSADVIFTSNGKNVANIIKVLSIDLVMDPARGGAFLRALNSTFPKGASKMSVPNPETPTTLEEPAAPQAAAQKPAPQPQAAALQHQITEDQSAVRELLNETARQQALEKEAAEARQVRLSMCGYLLESALASSHLPAPVAERLRVQFKDRVFTASELQTAIDDSRQMVSELTAAQSVQGPHISAMFTSEDQLSAAMHDLLGASRPEGLEAIKPAKLSGIRELYLMMTGDYNFSGSYDPTRVQFAATSDLAGVLKNALNKLIVQKWQELGRAGYRWWEPIVSVEHFNSLQSLTGVLVGEVSLLPAVSEGDPYTELDLSDSAETAAWAKYGGYVGLTIEMFERDETHKLRQYPQKLASSGLRRISNLVAAIFTANSGIGPVMTDTYKVFDAAHHYNLGTAALAAAAWETASAAIYNQSMIVASGGTAAKLALDAKYLLVPRTLRLTGMQILYPSLERAANIYSENMQQGQYGDVITVPDWTDVTDWAAVADPNLAPGIILAERFGLMPEIFIADNQLSGALFTNDEIRIKARHFVSVFVADYRPLYKSNVADG